MEFDITGTYMKKDGIGIWHLTQVIKWVKEDTTSNLYGRKIPFCLGKLIVLITFKSLSDYPYITLEFFARHFRKRSTHKCGISSIKIKFSCWLESRLSSRYYCESMGLASLQLIFFFTKHKFGNVGIIANFVLLYMPLICLIYHGRAKRWQYEFFCWVEIVKN